MYSAFRALPSFPACCHPPARPPRTTMVAQDRELPEGLSSSYTGTTVSSAHATPTYATGKAASVHRERTCESVQLEPEAGRGRRARCAAAKKPGSSLRPAATRARQHRASVPPLRAHPEASHPHPTQPPPAPPDGLGKRSCACHGTCAHSWPAGSAQQAARRRRRRRRRPCECERHHFARTERKGRSGPSHASLAPARTLDQLRYGLANASKQHTSSTPTPCFCPDVCSHHFSCAWLQPAKAVPDKARALGRGSRGQVLRRAPVCLRRLSGE